MKRVAIVQSNYIPWKGYFDLINMVDEFILYDDVQYTRRDWRNRNLIKTTNGTLWLTIPVKVKGKYHQRIIDTIVDDKSWACNHWKAISLNYAKANYFDELAPVFSKIYEQCFEEENLSTINYLFIKAISAMLGIKTSITWSMDYELKSGRVERLVHICKQAGADEYLSGSAAKCYLDENQFLSEGIAVSWMDYSGYPAYAQLHSPPFIHGVSIIDLLMNEGIEGAKSFMLSFKA